METSRNTRFILVHSTWATSNPRISLIKTWLQNKYSNLSLLALQVSQPTLQRGCEAKSKGASFQKEKRAGVATSVYSRKTLEKNQKRGLQILKIRVQELFTHGEGISTPRVGQEGQ